MYLYKKISEVLFMGIKIGVVGAGFFSGDFIRLLSFIPMLRRSSSRTWCPSA